MTYLCRIEKHFFADGSDSSADNSQCNTREDVRVISLAWIVSLTIQSHRFERRAAGENASSLKHGIISSQVERETLECQWKFPILCPLLVPNMIPASSLMYYSHGVTLLSLLWQVSCTFPKKPSKRCFHNL